jgi:zinc transport system substrate-binding protein
LTVKRFYHVITSLIALVLLLFLLGGCSSFVEEGVGIDGAGDLAGGEEQAEPLKTKPLKIVTTIFPLESILEEIGGDLVEVISLLPAGTTPHTYEPTVKHVKAVADADLIVFVGGGLDNWALGLTSAAENGSVLEIMGSMQEMQEMVPGDRNQNDPSLEGEETEVLAGHNLQDPHFWLDPVLVKDKVAPLLAERLSRLKPEQENYFAGNLKTFQAALEELDEEIRATVAGFSQTGFISYHSAWNYFAGRYRLQEIAAVEESPGKEPSGKWLAELVKLSEDHKINVIFAEPQLNSKAAEVMAKEINGRVFFLDPLGGKGLSGRESYLELMRYNTKIFEEALR